MSSIEDRIKAALGGLPTRAVELPWILFQGWRNLGFLSYRLDPSVLGASVPAELELDLYEGDAYLTLVPMHMVGLHVRDLPPLPFENTFPEINVRTYVKRGDRRGVYFFGIEANAGFAAIVARLLFHVPYNVAEMSFAEEGSSFRMTSARGASLFDASYRPVGDLAPAAPGSIEEFLTSRETSFAVDSDGRIFRGDVSHPPWMLQKAEVELRQNTLAAAYGIELPSTPTLAHFSPGTDSLCYPFVVTP